MPKIQLLSEDLINKIAAGEVIERPASVVKELVENSLDAKANKIIIEIKDSGKGLIKVSDNGEGMGEEDARNSLLRHATSKIKDIDDLFAIQTLGFRGEALASIAAVSRLELSTKQKDSLEGFNMVVEGGQIISSGVKGLETGTTIEVKDIFFNTPARKKFLKSNLVELRHIINVITNYALINKNVSFKLVHEGRELLNSPAMEDWKSNIASIYGVNLAKNLLEINHEFQGIKISGYVSKPYQARNDKTQQALFVNGRWVKNEKITQAIYDAFHSVLFVNKHPVYVLSLELNSKNIDVNVHPHKSEIKIEQNDLVYKTVLTAVKETLKRHNLVPILDFKVEEEMFGNQKSNQRYSFEPSKQTTLKEEKAAAVMGSNYEQRLEVETEIKEEVKTDNKEPIIQALSVSSKLPPLKIMGQIHKTFFVAETEGGVVFIDQHAAHERVLYEEFMQQFMGRKIVTQTLLQGEIIECNLSEKIIMRNCLSLLEKFGFIVEEFGGNSFIVKTVPSLFGRIQPGKMVRELAVKLDSSQNNVEEFKEEIITRMACRSAVMAGEELSVSEIELILRDLEQTELPFTCPHGRPTMIKTTAEELEKKFRRKG